MYEAYWGLSGAPFQNVPDPKFFCPLPAYREALEKLLYAVHGNKGGAVLTGEIGCGKSTLSRVFVLELAERYDVGLVLNPALPAAELLQEIAVQLGLPAPEPQRAALFRLLGDHLLGNARVGRTTALIVDEAHSIRDDAVFDDFRMLLNLQFNDRQLLTLILLGPPELRGVIARRASLDQRLPIRVNLAPLGEAETAKYVEFRLAKAGATRPIFTAEALRALAVASEGIPRRINNLGDMALFEGWKREARAIDTSLVKLALASL